MNAQRHPISPAKPVSAAAAALIVAAVSLPSAWADNLPLTLTVSETLQHDSNIFRTDASLSRADTTSSTGARLAVDKSYGLQSYTAGVLVMTNRYSNNDQLNNNSYQLDGTISSEFMRDFAGSASMASSRTLASFDVGGRQRLLAKNIRTTHSLDSTVRYGLFSQWSLDGTLNYYDQDYTIRTYSYPQQRNVTVGGKLRYNPTDLLNFSGGFRYTPGKTAYAPQGQINEVEDRTHSRNFDVGASWTVTGLSSLDARLTYTNQSHTLQTSTTRDVTGTVSWAYTPRGLITYNVYLSRDTGNNGRIESRGGLVEDTFANPTISFTDRNFSTTLGANLTWRATGKISITAGGVFTQNNYHQLPTVLASSTNQTGNLATIAATSRYSSISLRGSYTPLRWLQLSCNVQRVQHSGDTYTFPYDANVVGCTGDIVLNGQN